MKKRAKAPPSEGTVASEDAWLAILTDVTSGRFNRYSPRGKAQNTADFLSLFQIPTETEEGYTFMRMEGSHQFQFDNLVLTYEDWEEGRRADFINPKSRRRGCSQGWRAFFFERVVRIPGWRGTIIAQTDPDAMGHLESLHELAAQLPKGALAKANIRQVKSGAREIAFRHGRFRTSSVTVKTASARGLARGQQLNGILQTERPHWSPKAKKDRSAFLGSCRAIPGNIVIDESTANQHDDFHEDVMRAQEGVSDAHLIFLPSHEHDINRLPLRGGEAERLMAKLGKEKLFGERNEVDAYERRLTYRTAGCGWSEEDARRDALEFISWRRFKIANEFQSVRVFWREEPTTIEEAFAGSARTVLPIDIMDSWVKPADEKTANAKHGKLVIVQRGANRTLEFLPDHKGPLVVYEDPVPGEIYCFGGDTASGWEVQASSGTEADFSTLAIKELFSGRTVAEINAHMFPKPFAQTLLEAAVWYNAAKGYIETNLDTVVALLIEDADIECLGYVGSDILLTSERKMRVQGVGTQVSNVFGWRTTSKSKEYMAARHERFMVEWGEHDEKNKRGSPVGKETLAQMRKIIRKPTAKSKETGSRAQTKIEAEIGHDDRWVAEALAVIARDELMTNGEVPLASRVKKPEPDPFLAHFMRDEIRKREKELREPVAFHDPMTGELRRMEPERTTTWRGY